MPTSDPPAARPDVRLALARGLVVFALAAIGLGAFLAAGGSVLLRLGDLRLTARSSGPALVAALIAALLAAALSGRSFVAESARALRSAARRAWIVAALVALATFVVGLRSGSIVAGGADSSGYVNQASLWRSGTLRMRLPLLLRNPWPDAAWTLSPLGYRPGMLPDDIVPSYPPGLPLQFAAAESVAGDEQGLAVVVPLLGAVAVWLAFVIGRRAAGAGAGVAAAVLLAAQPAFLHQLVQPMSDVPVTAWWLLACALAAYSSAPLLVLSGVAAGVAMLTRPNLAPLVLVLPIIAWPRPTQVAGPRSRTALARWALLLAGFFPSVLFLAAFNATLYGAPWTSGYGDASQLFSWSNVPVNAARYGGWLWLTSAPVLVLALVGLAIAVAAPSKPGQRRIAWAAAVLVALVAACYLSYATFENWTYVRFFLPALAACAVLGGVAVARVGGLLPTVAREVASIALVAATAGLGVGFAREHGTFELHRQEERYRVVAEWVREHTDPDDLVLAAQHSGSIWHTARRRVVRWDLLDAGDDDKPASHARACAGRKEKADPGPTPWLDHVVGYGVATWLVVDADEEAAFRGRFQQASRCGLLDWPPYASTDPPSSVRVYRLSDRARHLAGESWTPLRIGVAPRATAAAER